MNPDEHLNLIIFIVGGIGVFLILLLKLRAGQREDSGNPPSPRLENPGEFSISIRESIQGQTIPINMPEMKTSLWPDGMENRPFS